MLALVVNACLTIGATIIKIIKIWSNVAQAHISPWILVEILTLAFTVCFRFKVFFNITRDQAHPNVKQNYYRIFFIKFSQLGLQMLRGLLLSGFVPYINFLKRRDAPVFTLDEVQFTIAGWPSGRYYITFMLSLLLLAQLNLEKEAPIDYGLITYTGIQLANSILYSCIEYKMDHTFLQLVVTLIFSILIYRHMIYFIDNYIIDPLFYKTKDRYYLNEAILILLDQLWVRYRILLIGLVSPIGYAIIHWREVSQLIL